MAQQLVLLHLHPFISQIIDTGLRAGMPAWRVTDGY